MYLYSYLHLYLLKGLPPQFYIVIQDEFLHTRLSLQQHLSLVEQDLEFLSDVSSVSRFSLLLDIHPGAGGQVQQPSVAAAGRLAEARGGPGGGAAQLARVEASGGGQGRPRRAGQGQAWRHMAGEHMVTYMGLVIYGRMACGIWA